MSTASPAPATNGRDAENTDRPAGHDQPHGLIVIRILSCVVRSRCDRNPWRFDRPETSSSLPQEFPRQGSGRKAGEDAGQLFAAAVAQSEGERRGGDTGEEKPAKAILARRERLQRTRTLHADVYAECCACGAALAEAGQELARAWDHVDLPPIKPITTRINLFRATCPCCKARVTAQPPADMPEGSPFGPGIKAAVAYLHGCQMVGFKRLAGSAVHRMTAANGSSRSDNVVHGFRLKVIALP